MNMTKTFDIDNEEDSDELLALLDTLVKANASDKDVIEALQKEYSSSSWFTVISFAEQYIYG